MKLYFHKVQRYTFFNEEHTFYYIFLKRIDNAKVVSHNKVYLVRFI